MDDAVMLTASDTLTLPMVRAACGGGFKDFDALLEVTAPQDLDAPNADGNTPLLVAIQLGSIELVQRLLAAGVTVDRAHPLLGTPLMIATILGDAAIMDVLLEGGADVELTNAGGYSALAIAVNAGHSDAMTVLIAAGASIDHTNGPGFLDIAESSHVLKALIDAGATVVGSGECPASSPLIVATVKANEDIVRTLLSAGADVNFAPDNIWTALTFACGENIVIAQLLLQFGANVDPKNPVDGSPLCVACAVGNLSLVNALVAAGANVNRVNHAAMTALLYAACGGHKGVARALLLAGANVNYQDPGGATALHLASELGHAEMVAKPWCERRTSRMNDMQRARVRGCGWC